MTADQVELYLSDPQQNWDVVKDDPDFLLVGEKKVELADQTDNIFSP